MSELCMQVFSNIRMNGHNKNTDGWDTLKSSNIVIQNSHVENGDDCVSFKPGSIDILVQGLVCSGSHGISVGSLGFKLQSSSGKVSSLTRYSDNTKAKQTSSKT